jgi:competence protein ComEA
VLKPKRREWMLFLAGVCCFALAYGLIWAYSGRFRAGPNEHEAGDISRLGAAAATPSPGEGVFSEGEPATRAPSPPERWAVYVTGAVLRPGVVWVSPGARVYQALEAAGGLAPRSDPEAVNLAARVADGEHLHVPAKGEPRPTGSPGDASPGAGAPPRRTAESPSGSGAGAPLDLNAATAAQLEALPGIGPKTAEAILRYREEKGGFRRLEDLMDVKGIGAKRFETLKGFLRVGP